MRIGQLVETITGPEARAHTGKLDSNQEEYPNPIQSERGIPKIAPDRVISFPAGS